MENILYLMYFKNREKMKQRKKNLIQLNQNPSAGKYPHFTAVIIPRSITHVSVFL